MRHRVLNDEKVHAEKRRLAFEASMARHASNRAAILHAVAEKAMAENAKAAAVVAMNAAKDKGTDPATAEAKSALYEKLANAEVARLHALRTRAQAGMASKGDTVSVIVVKRHVKGGGLRAPPPELSKRLSVVKNTLLTTARAAGGRRAPRGVAHAGVAPPRQGQRAAAALARLGKAAADLEEVTLRAARC